MRKYTGTLFMQYLRTPYTYIAFLLPILFIVGLGKMIPAGLIIPSAITIGVTVSILFLFGGSIQEMRSTSFIKSISLTKLSKSTIVLINMFVATVISVAAIGVILAFSFLLDSIGFLAQDFTAFSPNSQILSLLNATIIWKQVQWLTFIYAVILTAILSFAISFLIISLTKTTNSLYVVSFIYVFVMILMGGIIIPSILSILTDSFVQYLNVWIPHYYTNQLMAASMVTDNIILGEFIGNLENDQIAYYIVEVIKIVPPLENWNWGAISHDLDILNSAIAAGATDSWNSFSDFITSTYGVTNLYDAFDSQLFRILTTDLYTLGGDKLVSLINNFVPGPPNPITNSTIIRVISNLTILEVLSFGKYGIGGFLSIEALTSILTTITNNSDVIIQFTHSMTTWDFNSYESIASAFLPILIADVFATIGIYQFKWTIR